MRFSDLPPGVSVTDPHINPPDEHPVTRHPILDETGKVKAWLAAGRGVTIWENHEIGVDRPEILTPGDKAEKPHWAYEKQRTLQSADDVAFYLPVGIVESWKDGENGAGLRAAEKALETKYRDEVRHAAAGTFGTKYTLRRFTMGSIEIRPASEGGTTVQYRMKDEPSPTLLAVEFRIGVLAWSAHLSEEVSK